MASAAASSGKVLSRIGLMMPWSTRAPIFSSCSPLACMKRYSTRAPFFLARRSTLRLRKPRIHTSGVLRHQARRLLRRGARAHERLVGDGANAIFVEARIDRVADLEFGDARADGFHVA